LPKSIVSTTVARPIRRDPEIEAHRKRLDEAVRALRPAPTGLRGRGIVICGGGVDYFPGAWVCIRMLRHLGCRIPIQLWHLGPAEMNRKMRSLVAPFGVETVDAYKIRKRHPARILNGWEVKPYAIIHSPFREVLLLDADNVPVKNPEYLFDTPDYKKSGAIFWPDQGRLGPDRSIWAICGVEYRDEPEFESGQIVLDKMRCWKALQIAMHLNEYSDFYYQHMFGDKETYHMALRRIGQEYSMPSKGVHKLKATLCQHDFTGEVLFQHRHRAKWNLLAPNPSIPGFRFEKRCLNWLKELKRTWNGKI